MLWYVEYYLKQRVMEATTCAKSTCLPPTRKLIT